MTTHTVRASKPMMSLLLYSFIHALMSHMTPCFSPFNTPGLVHPMFFAFNQRLMSSRSTYKKAARPRRPAPTIAGAAVTIGAIPEDVAAAEALLATLLALDSTPLALLITELAALLMRDASLALTLLSTELREV